jgi:hypothetical protein
MLRKVRKRGFEVPTSRLQLGALDKLYASEAASVAAAASPETHDHGVFEMSGRGRTMTGAINER